MSLSDMIVFNEQVQLVATEVVDQEVALFNEASLGTIGIADEAHIGDFIEEAYYKIISSLINRRDAYGDAEVDDSPITQIKDIAVKVDGRVGPIIWTSEQFRRLGKSQEEAGLVIGEQAAKAMIQDYLNSAAVCLVAALEAFDHRAKTSGETSLILDRSTQLVSLAALNQTASLFGDRSQTIIVWLMHSKVWHDLIGEAITNTSRLYSIGDIHVMEDGLGRRYIVSDIPILNENYTI